MFVSQIFDECAEILGTTDEKKVFRKISQAVQTLMESGHWTHSTSEVDVCTGWDKCTLTLPRGIDIPLAVNIDGSPTYFRNRLFQYHVNKGGMYNSVEWAWDDRGYVATLMDITRPSQIVAVAESNNDAGKTLRLLGTDQYNRNLRSQLPNGAGVDGLIIPIHSQEDFAYGTITPDCAEIKTRDVAITPITNFTTTTPHGLTSGQGMSARVITGAIPVPLNDGQTYYVGVIDAYTVQLFSDSLNAQELQYPIALQSIENFGSMQLRSQRNAQVETTLQFVTTPTFGIDSPNEVVFQTAPLPAPLEVGKTYFAQPIDNNNFQIYPTLTDASNSTNPIYLTVADGQIDADIRKAIVPETKLTFGTKHYFNDGDQVQATTNGGVLPKPLIANQNYFVNVIDDLSVSIHTNRTDAINSTPTNFINPIEITTSGSGSNSIVKLIQSTAVTGTESQITAPTLQINPPTGSDAQFQPVTVGSVISVNITNVGVGYTAAPSVTFSDPPIPPADSGYLIPNKTAQGYATRNAVDNTITGIVITDPGSGYITAPTVTLSSPGVNPIISVTTLTANGTLATCTTQVAHGFSNGNTIQISGATPDIYNGTYVITLISPTSFQYTLSQSLGVPKTLTSITSGTVKISSITYAFTPYTYDPLNGEWTLTVNTTTAHGLKPYTDVDASAVTITGVTSTGYQINDWYQVLLTPSATRFTVSYSGSSTDSPGTINVTSARCWKVYQTQDSFDITKTYATATLNAHGLFNGNSVYIAGAIPAGLNGQVTVLNRTDNTFQYVVAGDLANNTGTATVFNSPATGTIIAKKPTASDATAVCSIQTSFISYYNQLNGGSGYANEPIVKISGGNGSGATAKATVVNGVITKLTPITAGTGYSGAPSVTITPSTGFLINFSSTGSLPSPLSSGTTYRLETPLNTASGNYTVKNLDFSDVDITSVGAGTFYTVLSRVFGVDFTNNWRGNFSGVSTGQQIYFGSDYSLPLTTPSIDNGITPFWLNKISDDVSKIYSNSSLTTLVDVDSLGYGQSYYAIRVPVIPSVASNLIKPVDLGYLSDGQVVQFNTSGTLPTPLYLNTDYTIKIIGDAVRVYNGSTPVILQSTGVGQLSLDIVRNVTVQPSTSIIAESSLYETGTKILTRAKSGDILPNGLIGDTNYYVRRIDNNTFEIYDTLDNAQNVESTTGRKTYTTTGKYVDSTFFVDAIYDAVMVKSVAHIEKPITDGYVSLYAYDYGRSNDMTLIGQYHPTEVNPSYRRIRIGKPCAWARIIYKVTPTSVSSIYDFIPLEQERAIIAAVHAVDLEDKDFADQAIRYWQIAFNYLKNQQESIDGHAMTPPQVNAITYGDCGDVVMW